MKRNITITIENSTDENHIHINNINNIINYSCDSISISCLEFLPEQTHIPIISSLMNKLRPSGRLIFLFSNPKLIAQNFINGSVLTSEFLKYFVNKQSLLSIESIYQLLDLNSFSIIHIDLSNDIVQLIIERKNQ